MFKNTLLFIFSLVAFAEIFVHSCLITNCPRGGKRTGKFGAPELNIKACISCGPEHSGRCFGPNICCGPFGCLMGTPETMRCKQEGLFQESEPCIAGSAPCRRNTGRCALDGVCCNQDSCYIDKDCALDGKIKTFSNNVIGLDLYNLMNAYPTGMIVDK